MDKPKKRSSSSGRKKPAGSDENIRFKTLFEQSPYGVLIIDTRGNVLDFNDAAHTQLGYTREEFGRIRIADIDPIQDPEEIRASMEAVLKKGSAEFEVKHRTKNGELRDVHVITRVLVLSGETVFHTIWRDITEQKQAEEAVRRSEEKFRTLFDYANDAIFILDLDGNFIDANKVAYTRLGYARDQFLAMHVSRLHSPAFRAMIPGKMALVREQGQGVIVSEHVKKDGTIMPVEISARLIDYEGKKVIFSIIRDVTERKKIEEARVRSEKRFHALFDNTPLGIVIVGPDRRILDCNAAFQNMLGYSLEELQAKTIPEISHAGDDLATGGFYEAMVEGKRDSFSMEKRHIRKDGTLLWTHLTGTVIRDENGKQNLLFGIVEDISQRKRTENDLQVSETRLNEAQQIAHLGTWEWDVLTNQVFWSDELFRIYGYQPREISPDYGLIVNAMHPDSKKEFLGSIDAALKGERPFDMNYTFFRSDGSAAVLHTIGKVIRAADGKPERMFGIVQDITEQKRAQDAIRESEEKFRSIFNTASDGILIADRSTKKFTSANTTICNMLGYTLEDMLNLGVGDIHPPKDLPHVLEEFDKQARGEKKVAENLPVLRKNGSVFYADVSTTPIVLGGEQHALGIFRDITERKKMEEDLLSSRDFIERILNTVDEAFIIIDQDYRIIKANNAYAAQVSMSLQEIIGKRCHEISHHSLIPCFETGEECAVKHCFDTGEPYTCVHKHVSKDGTPLFVEIKAFPLKDGSGRVTSAIEVINNITDKHLLEEQLLRTQKLEAVGLLAGGIAHDFNNLLQGIFGSISMAKAFTDRTGKAYAMLEGAELALYQARSLTKQLLTFSKGGEPVKKMVALPAMVDNAVKFALSGSNVIYRSTIDEDLRTVEADEGQLSQVLHNIVLNACDAMPDGGTVAIELRHIAIDEKSGLPLKKGNYACIAITDSGSGIPEEHLSRIFDPYFTTKKKGNGLGLATSYSIIKKHGGTITVRSKPGAGSTFSVYLPESGQQELALGSAPVTGLVLGKGRVLVMDDEEIVRKVADYMIAGLGYEIAFAENGEQAVAQYAAALAANRPFDVVILDLTVRGGMGGKETLKKIQEMDPKVKAIVSSGYSADDVLSQYRENGFQAVLSKPYEVEVLSHLLHQLIPNEG